MVLYRGINPDLHNQIAGELLPKDTRPFVRSPEYGRAEWGNFFWGECEANAVVEHQNIKPDTRHQVFLQRLT